MINRFRIGTKIGASFALGVAIFAGIGLLSYQSAIRLMEASRRVTHTYLVLSDLENLLSTIKDAETGQRGYIITGEEEYLVPYRQAQEQLQQKVADLRNLTTDNDFQQQRLDELELLINRRVAVLEEVLALRRTQGLETAAQAVRTDRGRSLMDQIRATVARMDEEERRLLQLRALESRRATRQMLYSILLSAPLYSILLALIGFALARHISKPLKKISDAAERLGEGDLSISLPSSDRRDEIGVLTHTFNDMVASLRDTNQHNEEQTWLKSNLAEFTQMLQGRRDLVTISRLILSDLASLIGAQQGLFYLLEDDDEHQPVLKLLSSYAHQERKHLSNQFRLGEGLVGQCALEQQRILLTDVPGDYIRISSGLGEISPLNIIVLPVSFENQVTAVIELASLQRFREIHLTFLDEVSGAIGVVLNAIVANRRNEELLEYSQTLTTELQESNRLLEEQARSLQESEALLKQQQEELQQSNEELQQLNEELEEKAELLSVQNQEVERKNNEIEQARRSVEEKAEQLALTSKYKSEFLANMSHELRTPLNSLLILARLLGDNPDGNLSGKQVEYIRTIYSAGTDLLELINDILDLAKIESGTMSVEIEPLQLTDLKNYVESNFEQLAQTQNLTFRVELAENLPDTISTDARRLQQVLKNLLSNAFKFTDEGSITLRMAPANGSFVNGTSDNGASSAIAFSVIDTGIGISPEKQAIIFEAFQQADGTTSRKYGGTGLGLSISRELAQLLGGWIELTSQLGQGSTFTLYLPQLHEAQPPARPYQGTVRSSSRSASAVKAAMTTATPSVGAAPPSPGDQVSKAPRRVVADDYGSIQPGDRTLLIVEDDLNFARILLDMAREQGFKVLVASRSEDGLALAREYKPNAIMLDIHLPDLDGWTVLDRLKHDPGTRHIPVHILSVDDEQQRGFQLGAIAYLQKPISPDTLTQALVSIKGFIDRQVRRLLVIEDDHIQAESIRELIGNGDVQTTVVGTGSEALTVLKTETFDCVVLDLGLPDMDGFELIEQIKQEEKLAYLPIIVYTGKELSRPEETRLKRLAETIIVKDVRSPERLLDETALFLHRIQANLPQAKRQMLEQLHQTDSVLVGKTVLIIDDDVRNIFALTSLLERYEMNVLYAENGKDGIDCLRSHPEVDVVLMDVMMPGMDGYETTRTIRVQEQMKTLPIIALTAKAMQGDREKCIEAGASDYISKPVDTEQLLSLLRVWLYR
ncbi:response regulator [Oculatella sp. LEGE 06141]|uniref:response regulator n=1 Tax=Oculatella sp. LEGE 06141 TaxID=1828648 RepID=UPI0018830BB7|nr:response regulator [Oculatella sp. LEGE 06141]MBE9180457.1 response regulator [Oculatella sp. LEGE 06141]